MRIFCESRCIFPNPAGGRRGEEYEQWAKCPLVFYAKPSNKRFIIPPQKKGVILQLTSIFLVRVFRNILIPSLRMTLTMSKCSRVLYAKALNERLIILPQKMLFWLLFSIWFSSAGSSSSAIVAPFASAGIRPVVNRLNQGTTVYYGLVFCLFSWPYMVKWHNSGIINWFNALNAFWGL